MVSRAGSVVDDDGEIADEKTLEQLRSFVHEFACYVNSKIPVEPEHLKKEHL